MAPVLLVFAGTLLTACAQWAGPRAGEQAPITAPPAKSGPAAVPAASIPPAEAAPSNAQWIKPGVTNAEYRADIESCFGYAEAQIAHDVRIESDSSAAFDVAPRGLGVTELRDRMSAFERKNRRASLYRDCMRAKGYSAQQ